MVRDPPVGIEIRPPNTLEPESFPSVKVPFRAKAPLMVVIPVLLLVKVILAFMVTAFKVISPEPVKAWLAVVENVFAPVPVSDSVPLLAIPPRNSKGALLEEVKDPVPEMVGNPTNNFNPEAPVIEKTPSIVAVVETVKVPVLLLVIVMPEATVTF